MSASSVRSVLHYNKMFEDVLSALKPLEDARQHLFNNSLKMTEKLQAKRERFLLEIPLFSLIYQKKGEANFRTIVENIRITRVGFGEVIFGT